MSIYSALFMFHHLENKIKDHKDFEDHKEISKIIYLKIIIQSSLRLRWKIKRYYSYEKKVLHMYSVNSVRDPRTKFSLRQGLGYFVSVRYKKWKVLDLFGPIGF